MDGAVSEVQEESQAPALRDLVRLWVQFGQDVGVLGLRGHDGLPGKVRELGDLVREHGLHRLLAEQSRAGRGVDAVVQQHADDLGVLVGPGEAAGAALLEDGGALGVSFGDQRRVVEVAVERELEVARVKIARVHVRELRLHLGGGEHVDVRDAHGGEDVLLEVVVERQARGALDADARPVDVDPIFPCLSGLVDEGLRQIILFETREFVDPRGAVEIVQALVEE